MNKYKQEFKTFLLFCLIFALLIFLIKISIILGAAQKFNVQIMQWKFFSWYILTFSILFQLFSYKIEWLLLFNLYIKKYKNSANPYIFRIFNDVKYSFLFFCVAFLLDYIINLVIKLCTLDINFFMVEINYCF